MKKSLFFVAVWAAASVLCAQESPNFGREDVMAAFKEYNPAALEKAAQNPAYNELLNKLADAYHSPRTEASRNELIALVKNFDNSLRLQAVRNAYFEGRTLQRVSGTELNALDEKTAKDVLAVVRSIFKNTLEVKNIQIKDYKARLKAVKKDPTLSAQEKEQAVSRLENQIRSVKREIKQLKSNSKQKIRDTASVYFGEIRSDFAASEQASAAPARLEAEQSSALDVKANHKKPVAK